MLEKAIERRLANHGRSKGFLTFKLTADFNAGMPDRLVLCNGKAYFVELKVPGKAPRPIQLHMHRLLQMQGFEVAVLDCPERVDEFVRRILG
jgi:hypothetical protein